MVVLFFFNDTATTEIYTLSLHDALPIVRTGEGPEAAVACALAQLAGPGLGAQPVGVAVEDEHGLLDPLDRLLEAVVEVDLERMPDPSQPGALPVGGVVPVEVRRLQLEI